jgi:Na+/melibiose symporter-like transporter
MLPLMSPNPKDRMGVGLWQTYFRNWGGDFIAGMIMPLLDLSRRGFSSINPSMIFAGFGIFTAFLGSGSSLLMAVGCQERVLIQPKPAPISKSIFYILKNKYMLRKFLADFSISWWNGSGYNWDVVTQMEIFGGVFRAFYAYLPRQVMQIVSLSFIERFKTMFGGSYRKTVIFMRLWDFLASTLGGVIGSRKMFMKHFWAVSLIFALFDGINCANNAPSTVLENEIDREIKDYTEYMTGERPDGTIGLLTGLISKVTAPLNTLFTLFVLRWSGYDQTQGEGLTANWSQAGVMENYTMYSRVFLLYMAGSFLPQLVQTIPLFFYDLEGKKKEDMYIALNERRALMAKTASEEEIEALAEMLVEETE